jgi:hypothetical protein
MSKHGRSPKDPHADSVDRKFDHERDTYKEEFGRLCQLGKKVFPSLLNVHEVHDSALEVTDFAALGYPGYKPFVFEEDAAIPDYGTVPGDFKNGHGMVCYLEKDDSVRAVVLISRKVQFGCESTEEQRYAFKCLLLLHEFGHIDDMEKGINFDCKARTIRLMESEVYAELFMIDMLLKRNLTVAYRLKMRFMEKQLAQPGYITDVAKLTLARMPKHKPL